MDDPDNGLHVYKKPSKLIVGVTPRAHHVREQEGGATPTVEAQDHAFEN